MLSATAFLDEPQAQSASAFLDEEPGVTVTQPEGYASSFGPGTRAGQLVAALEPDLPHTYEDLPPELARPTEEETLSDRIRKFLFEPEGAQITREAIQGAVKSIPGMIKQLPGQAYQGIKFATGGPEARTEVIKEALREGVPMGVQTAEDLQAPFGTPEFLRGAGQTAMMATPGLELLRELRTPPVVPRGPEPPPFQAQPPPIPPEYAERRFTMQEPPPEAPPDISPSVPIEQTLPNIKEPLPFNPEAGPAPRLESPMPLRTETANLKAERVLAKRQELLNRQKDLKQRFINGEDVGPELEAVEAEINNKETNPVVHPPPLKVTYAQGVKAPKGFKEVAPGVNPAIDYLREKGGIELSPPPLEGPVQTPGGAQGASEAPGGVPVAEPTAPLALEIPEADKPYAGEAPTPGIANRVLEEQIKAGTLPEEALVAGKGTTPEIATARAREAVAKDPNVAFEAARRVHRNEMHPDDPAILHAYNDQLAEGAAQAAKASIENPGNVPLKATADAAEQAHMDFLQNVLPKAKGQAQRTLVGFQGATPPNYATYAGMLKELGDFNGGKGLTNAQRMQLYKRGLKGERLKAQTDAGLDKMQQTIDRTMPKTKTPNPMEMRSMMEDFVEKVTPCE